MEDQNPNVASEETSEEQKDTEATPETPSTTEGDGETPEKKTDEASA